MADVSRGYVCCPVENRTALLAELLCKYWDRRERAWTKKVVVVFCHNNSIKFHTELLQRIKELPIIPLMKVDLLSSGGLDDYRLFQAAETGVLAVTAVAAQRLLDLSADTIIQYDPPSSAQAVYELSAQCSNYLLFLRPQETGLVAHLTENQENFDMEERYVPWDQVPKLPKVKIQHFYKTYHSININSKGAYKAYMDSIRDHKMKKFFNLEGILIKEVAQGFCFVVPPYYDLIKETPRYELELQRKAKKNAEPLPKTAKVKETTFTRIFRDDDSDKDALNRMKTLQNKNKQPTASRKKGVNAVRYTEDGLVDLSRDASKTSKRQKRLKGKKSDVRAVKRLLANSGTGKRVSKRAGMKRRRPAK